MTVSDNIIREATLLGIAILLGAALMLLYDVIRIFRRILPRGIIWVSLEDLIYWLVFGLAVFIMLYQENDGAVRGFLLGGIALGVLLYYWMVSRWFMKRMSRFIRFVKKQLKKLWKAITIKS